MKDYYRGALSLDGFVGCFALPEAVDLYAATLEAARSSGVKEHALLVEIDRRHASACHLRLFTSTEPNVWSMSTAHGAEEPVT